VIGFCGRLVEEKGLLDLIEATNSLRNKYPHLQLVLLGQGVLQQQIESIDPSGEWLKILPAVRHEEIPAFINKLDVFVLPSKPLKTDHGQVWEEQFGHVLIEAMACGVLTLGSDSGAIPEVLNDPDVTFRHSDRTHMASVIDTWLNDQPKRAEKAASQRQICAKKWTHEAVAKAYSEFLWPRIDDEDNC
jgi:glycosyltransferase involved in cell wall biosynthesis